MADEDVEALHGTILKAIENNDPGLFAEALDRVDWENLGDLIDTSSALAQITAFIIQACHLVQNSEFVTILFKVIQDSEPEAINGEPRISPKTRLFLQHNDWDDDIYVWLHKTQPPLLADMLLEAFQYDGGEDFSLKLDKMERVTNYIEKSPYNYYTALWNILPSMEERPWNLQDANRAWLAWIVPRASKDPRNIAPEPFWSNKFNPIQVDKLIEFINKIGFPQTLPETSQYLDRLQNNSTLYRLAGLFNPLVLLELSFPPSSAEEVLELLCPMLSEYGPPSVSNLDPLNGYYYDDKLNDINDDRPISDEFVLLHELDDEPAAEPQTWFTGYCWECFRGIKHKHWAIRRPEIAGGWYGCYCSFECAEFSLQSVECVSEQYPAYIALLNKVKQIYTTL